MSSVAVRVEKLPTELSRPHRGTEVERTPEGELPEGVYDHAGGNPESM